MNDNIVFIDVQGFKSNSNDFIAKEVAIAFNNNDYFNFIIKPPFNFKCLSIAKQREANWLIKNYHHINWNDGSVSFNSVCKFLKANIKHSEVYVKGKEKRKWLEEMLHKKVLDIEDVGCINFKQMEIKYPEYFYCSYHSYGVCALRNALLLTKEKSCLK